MIRLKIDLTKLTGARTFTAKDGTPCIGFPLEANNVFVGKNGAHYLDLTLMENRDGRDKYDNDGFCTVDVGKERRQAGEKGPILGNWKDLDGGSGQAPQNSRRNPMGGTDRTAAEAMPSRHQQQKQDGYQRDNGGSEPDDETIPFMRKPAPFQP